MNLAIPSTVHRIGRTGRCGKTGIATTFVNKLCGKTCLCMYLRSVNDIIWVYVVLNLLFYVHALSKLHLSLMQYQLDTLTTEFLGP